MLRRITGWIATVVMFGVAVRVFATAVVARMVDELEVQPRHIDHALERLASCSSTPADGNLSYGPEESVVTRNAVRDESESDLSLGRSHRVPRLFRNRLQKWRMYRPAHLHRALRRLKIRARHSPFIPIFSGAKNATISIATMLLTVLVSCAFAGSQKRDFPEVLVTEDATPDNTLEIGPGWNREHDASDFNFEASIEKKLSENTSVEVTMTYDSITRSLEHSSQGFDNLEFLGKWALFRSPEHEAIVTLAAQAFPSTGDPGKGAETHTRAGPVLLWEKGLGDLPDDGRLHYIRPLALLNELSYLPTWGGPESGEFVCNFALQYPLQYLADSGERLQFSAVSAGFTPFIEFNYDQVAVGKRHNTPPDFRISEGLAYQFGPYQLTVGTQIPLNGYASHGLQAAVLTLIDVDLEPLIPGAGATLF